LATIVSLDIGTSKLCALALKVETLEPLALHSAPNGADIAGLPADVHEQDPSRLRDQAFELLAKLLADKAVSREDVAALSLTGQMHGVLLSDPDLCPTTNLITWRDRRVVQAGMPGCLDEARQALEVSGSRSTGCRLCAGYGGSTLYHLARNGGLPKQAMAMTIADYIGASLTGVIATEPSHAASWGLLNLQSRQWDFEMVRQLGLPPEILPPLRGLTIPLGLVHNSLSLSLGLPRGVPVCMPIGDNQASIMGVAGLARDVAVVNLGTGGQISIPQPEPVWVDGFETRPMPLGGFVLVGASLCGGWSYAYLRRFIQELVRQFSGVELDDHAVYERLNRLAAEAPPDAAGLFVNPFFSGTRDDPERRGTIGGIDTQNLTSGNLARAFIEGMVGELADLFHAAGTAGIARIATSGNAVRENKFLLETIAARFGRQCCLSQHPEEAAFGAAYAAAITTCPGAVPPRAEHRSPISLPPLHEIASNFNQTPNHEHE
jgi:sugar (pentulose or hexulose) kinase